jgi:hypothetical protein
MPGGVFIMPGEKELLSDLINEMRDRFTAQGFNSKITVDDTGAVETITFMFVRDNTRDAQCQMLM